MSMMSILLGFLEGFVLILSPCILPVLPIILATSLTGTKWRPIGITCGFTLCFTLTAFFARQIIVYTHIDLNIIRHVSYLLLVLLGFVMLSTRLTDYWALWLSKMSTRPPGFMRAKREGFGSGFVFGSVIALIWVPCAGPILAAVIVQTVIQQANWVSFLVLLAFSVGAALPMLGIALYGNALLNHFDYFKHKAAFIRKALGFIIILSVAWMVIKEDYQGQARITTSTKTATALQQGLYNPYKAPDLMGITAWVNGSTYTLSDLRGKVTLIDFWTYSCINCLRTIPYLNAFYAQYHEKGLHIIGVHSPEFAFEKDLANVEAAVKSNGIKYPVALDNNFATWLQYHNHYWPAQYLIDQEGNVVYQHFGEGNEEILENNIRYLLHIKGNVVAETHHEETNHTYALTPETYLGYERSSRDNRPKDYVYDKPTAYHFPKTLPTNAWALDGEWQVLEDHIVALKPNATLKIHFNARKLYLVMGSDLGMPISALVFLNGKLLSKHEGKEVKQGVMSIQAHTLYALLDLDQVEDGELEVKILSPGLSIYTITFGA